MRIKKILTELFEEQGRTLSVEGEKEAKDILQNNCRNFDPSSPNIYRGIRGFGESFGYIAPAEHTRQSANTANYYTLLIDNSSAWAAFPDRSKSIICTTDRSYAKDFGDVYHIIPFDNANFGLALDDDIWTSIDNLPAFIGDLDQLNAGLIRLFDFFFPDQTLSDDSIESFKGDIDRLTVEIHSDVEKSGGEEEFIKKVDNKPFFPSVVKNFIADFLDSPHHDFYVYLENMLDPSKNSDIKLAKYPLPNSVGDSEVWTDSPALMVHEMKYNSFINKNFK